MIDYQNLPDNTRVDWFMQPASGTEVSAWTKPSGCNFVYMIAVGPGGNGGNGASGAINAPRGGGGGGGTGAISILHVPAFLIPDTLFIRVGAGGSGAATIISAYRVLVQQEYLLLANSGSNGGNGTGSGGGVGGAGGSGSGGSGASSLATVGVLKTFGGNTGGGGSHLDVPGITISVNGYLCAGSGGGGTTTISQVGGGSTGQYFQPSSIPIVRGGVATGDGNGGFQFGSKRFAFFGGSGGGSTTGGTGGNGGKGAPGCGGGGGGAGVTGGTGGRGGDGFVIIISY